MISKKGFSDITTIIFVIALIIITILSITLSVKKKELEKKDETIRIIKTEKVKDDVISENSTHEIKHETIGKLLQDRKVIHAEINTSNGHHTIIFE